MILESTFKLYKSYSLGIQIMVLCVSWESGEVHKGETGFKEVSTEEQSETIIQGGIRSSSTLSKPILLSIYLLVI